MSTVAQGRINKTIWFFEERSSFMVQLAVNIRQLVAKATKQGKKPLVRLNGTSDIRWESVAFIDADGTQYVNIFAAFPDVQFYDYTKIANRKDIPSNYDLTFSYSGVKAYQPFVDKAVAQGMRIAVVFRNRQDMPSAFNGMSVVDGDNSDIRHLDDQGVVVGLYAKGKAKLDDTGFVVQTHKVFPIALAA